MKLQRGWIFFGCGDGQQASGGWNVNHGLRYHLSLIAEDVKVKDAVAPAY